MTEPRDIQGERQGGAATDPEPEVRPEVISDLDLAGDDADLIAIAGGCDPSRAALP
jgi:hypothetical protein